MLSSANNYIQPNMTEQATSIVHKYLDQALPLQPKLPLRVKSLLDFVIEEPGNLKDIVTQSQELNKTPDQYLLSKKNIHHIGDTLCELFRQPIYKAHELISTSSEETFGQWKTDENFKLSTWHREYPLNDDVLQFQSRFQSGNLGVVSYSALNPKAYYLALQKDSNSSKSTTQWFYFRVKNRGNVGEYTFHIVNYVKPFSMFRVGMKPCVYSFKSAKGWERTGSNIEYRRNSIRYEEQKSYYTLSFSYQFTHLDDQVYFAYCYPYTYTRLQRFLDDIEQRHVDKMRRKVLSKTLGDNAVELVIITNPQIVHKRVLCFSARVHPGETISSFVCEAIIEFLVSHPDAERLRNQFIIKIIPMLNPDGVIHGNYRTSLSGSDLNRQWKNPDKALHQQIYYSKKIITQSQYKKLLYIDIHGHSKKRSSFMYGCVSHKNPYVPKELPYILSKQMQHFSYFNCNFTTPKSKEGTSRITLWKAGIQYSYTYQLSFCGPQKEKRHFNIKDYEAIGAQLCRNLSGYFCNRILALEADQQLNNRCQQFYDDQQLLNMGNEETNGSSSELQDEKVRDVPCTENLKSRNMFKRGHPLSSQRTENRQISHILQSYLSKYQGNQCKNRGDEGRDQNREKGDSDKEIYVRQKQSFMATRVNLQQIALQDHLFTSMSSFYGLAAEKSKPTEQINQPLFKNISHSFSYSEKKSDRNGNDSLGLLLPNVQKGHYKKYDRYKRSGKSVCQQRIISMHVQSVIQQSMMSKLAQSNKLSNQSNKFKREISLAERIRSRTNDRRDTKF